LQKILKGITDTERGRKIITITRGQEGVKLTRDIDEPMRAREVSSMINSINQQNRNMNIPKVKKNQCENQPRKRNNKNIGISNISQSYL
jgi:hypothetical protein